MVADAVREKGLIHVTASVGLGRDDVVFGVREIEPVLGAMVELEADFRAPIIFGTE